MATLEKELSKGVRIFEYRKVDGSVRKAIGTLNSKILESAVGRKSKSSASRNVDVTLYFDMEAQAFRSFRTSNFIGFKDDQKDPDESIF